MMKFLFGYIPVITYAFLTVQVRSRSSTFAQIERPYVHDFLLVIVTLALSLTVTEL